MDRIVPLPYEKVVRIFEAAGCRYNRTNGDHMIFSFPGARRPIVIPKYREIPTFIIKNNMRIIGLLREEFLELGSRV